MAKTTKYILKKDINYMDYYFFKGSEFPENLVTQKLKDDDFFEYVDTEESPVVLNDTEQETKRKRS